MKKSALVCVLFCTAALFYSTLASSALAQEVVVNGGFETGTFSNWTVVDSSNFTNIGPDPLFAHSGTYHANLGAKGILGSLSQTLSTTPSGSYTLSFWLTNDSGATPNEFDVFWNGASIYTSTNSPVSLYTQFTFSNLVATGAATVLEFRYRNDDDFFRLDDVSVVPEPSVTWLVLPGLGLLGLLHYRGVKRRRLSVPV